MFHCWLFAPEGVRFATVIVMGRMRRLRVFV
jgi:hypothetical protein